MRGEYKPDQLYRRGIFTDGKEQLRVHSFPAARLWHLELVHGTRWAIPQGYTLRAGNRAGGLVALLAHADEIGFFERPDQRPLRDAEFAHLIRLTRRALNDREGLTSEMLGDQAFAALLAARAAGPGGKGASDASVISWPALTPARGPPGTSNDVEVINRPEMTSG